MGWEWENDAIKVLSKILQGITPLERKIEFTFNFFSIYTWDSLLGDKLDEEETEQDWEWLYE